MEQHAQAQLRGVSKDRSSRMSRKYTHRKSSPSQSNMAALAYSGLETCSRPRRFPLPDSSANTGAGVTADGDRGASAQVRTAGAGGIWAKSPGSDHAESVGLLVLSLSFYFPVKCPYSTVF